MLPSAVALLYLPAFLNKASLTSTFAVCSVGWRVSQSAKTVFALDTLDQALHDRRLVRHWFESNGQAVT